MLRLAALAAPLLPAAVAGGSAPTTPSATILGPAEMIYDWGRDHCADGLESWNWDVPDTPARMWRRKSGETTLIASNNLGSHANIGPDPGHLRHSCDLYYNNTCANQDWYGKDAPPCSAEQAICCDPSKWADREWIFSPWIFPENDTVVALAHMEFHSQNNSAETMCDALTKEDSGACWFNAITAFESHDGGRQFSRMREAPDHLVAAQPYKMPAGGPGPGNNKMPMGYEAPSNILLSPIDGYYYAIMQTWSYGAQRSSTEWGGNTAAGTALATASSALGS